MTNEEMIHLRRGDLVRNIGSGESYIVLTKTEPTVAVVARVVQLTNGPEWEFVKEGFEQ